jgi:hypothetical protein
MANRQSSRQARGIGLILELGPGVKIIINQPGEKNSRTLILDNWVANFHDAIEVPAGSYKLKDFCGANFFKRKVGLSPQAVYKNITEGDPDGAELFVEYGSHVGSLIANLEILLQPSHIRLSGPLTKTFDAWGHAMGKTRKMRLGKKPKVKITVNS